MDGNYLVFKHLKYSIFLIRYFGKIGGLLGKMNNEKYDDMTTSDNQITNIEDEFVQSWRLASTCSVQDIKMPLGHLLNASDTSHCHNLYKRKTSYFASCFSAVNPDPFFDICVKLGSALLNSNMDESFQKAACTSGVSYIEACSFENIPLRVPDSCIQ